MKSIHLTLRPRKVLLLLLQIWILASGLYYIENLFSPNYYMGYEEGVLHKFIKYVICIFFTIAFGILSRAYSLLLIIALMMVLSVLLVLNRGSIEISALSILITASMIAFVLVPSIWETDLRGIGRVTVYVGAVVGVFSIIELTVLATLFESFWASTGSIRSASTLFNPNNLGLYAGACLILVPYLGLRLVPLSVCVILIFFAFAASGSRTAWLSLLMVVGYNFFVSKHFRSTVIRGLSRHSMRIFILVAATALMFTSYQVFRDSPPDIEVVHRGVDLYTASIRWSNFVSFINALDLWIMLPDFSGERSEFIQDNFYLVFLNSFGIIGVILFMSFFATHFSLRTSVNQDMIPWRLVFAFYMVSGLSGSHLNSFPNNQLFFLSMGAIFVLDMRFLRFKMENNKGRDLATNHQISF